MRWGTQCFMYQEDVSGNSRLLSKSIWIEYSRNSHIFFNTWKFLHHSDIQINQSSSSIFVDHLSFQSGKSFHWMSLHSITYVGTQPVSLPFPPHFFSFYQTTKASLALSSCGSLSVLMLGFNITRYFDNCVIIIQLNMKSIVNVIVCAYINERLMKFLQEARVTLSYSPNLILNPSLSHHASSQALTFSALFIFIQVRRVSSNMHFVWYYSLSRAGGGDGMKRRNLLAYVSSDPI